MNMLVDNLLTQGVTVLSLFTQAEINDYHQSFIETMHNQTPELIYHAFAETTPTIGNKLTKKDVSVNPTNSIHVYGGFGAFATASSFHSPIVRKLRKEIYHRTQQFFREFITAHQQHNGQTSQLHLEQLLDRFCVRRVGTSTTAETWHRDQSPIRPTETPDDRDLILGGWLNLDLQGGIQHFSCNPRTHNVQTDQPGFQPLSNDVAEAQANKQVFSILPGQLVVFYQNLIHEVFPTKSMYDSMRQFVGWRITSSSRPLFVDCAKDKFVLKEFKQQAHNGKLNWHDHVFVHLGVPPIPSGQHPRMYSKSNMNFQKKQLMEWATEQLNPLVCVTLPHKKTHIVETLPMVHCPSLKQQHQLGLFPPYNREEIMIHYPQQL